jgi:hypothetical protein
VLRREELHQACTAQPGQQHRGVRQSRIDRCLVGEQADAPSGEETSAVVDEDLEAGPDGGHG